LVGGDEETPAALIVCPGSLLSTSFDSHRPKQLIWATGSGNSSANDRWNDGRRKPEDPEVIWKFAGLLQTKKDIYKRIKIHTGICMRCAPIKLITVEVIQVFEEF